MVKKESLRELIRSIVKYKRDFILANIIAVIAVLISLPIPMMIPLLIDEILLNKPSFMMGYLNSILGEGREVYIYVFVVLIFVIFIRAIFLTLSAVVSYLFAKISKDITYNLQRRLIEYISKVSISEYENFGSGKISSLLVVDLGVVDNFLGVTINKFIVSILTIIGIGIVLLWINWQLGLFILILMPIISYFTKKVAKRVGKIKRVENKNIESFSNELGESMDLFWQIKASNLEKSFEKNLIKRAEDIKESSIEFKYKSEIAAMFSYFLFLAGFEVFRSAGILSVEYSDLSIGKMLGIFGYLWVIMSPFSEIISIQYAYHTANEALNRINKIYDMKQESSYPHKKNPFLKSKKNSIHLKDVRFSYHKKEVLKGVDIKANGGENIAIVGETGGGKSTIASLLVGFYEVDSGDILYDGISYKEIGFDVIREHTYLTLQTPHIFDNTIRYNLCFEKDVSDEKIKEALKIAQLDEFVFSLENGIDEVLGKNGVKLSGGQKQRLSIARMIIADPNIVILDESTSSLDVETEKSLFDALLSFLNQRTTIIIAHRLSTITKADRIYFISDGRVVEEGSFDELIALNGRFKNYIKRGNGC